MGSSRTSTYPSSTSDLPDTGSGSLLPWSNPMSFGLSENLLRKPLPVMHNTLPTWRQHAHVVHIVDFNAEPQASTINEAPPETEGGIESGIFIQTHHIRMSGDLYMPHQSPYSCYYELERQEFHNITQHECFNSASPIGFIYDKDYEHEFGQLLHQSQLPCTKNSSALPNKLHRNNNDENLSPCTTTE
ncbi:hypothetical protein BKA59DRAFT_522113 [Fusarium tricinctum]|uniref:Uncharacterized protein n=1 Tax=Fusarium tricinctum TaxID=61284 RepID=A0A8K0S4S8_9HYPO|nr:hypothetical protein BKA59DRAFT_522113 [Fusarium tricinctum]